MMLHFTRLGNGEGESVNSGMSAAFLRSAFFNLKCTCCDTKYSWSGNNMIKKLKCATEKFNINSHLIP